MAALTSPPRGPLIPTPPASSVEPSHHPSPLPKPRKHPLKPGGPKESELIHYLDQGLNSVQRRSQNRVFHKTNKAPDVVDGEMGYQNFSEAAKDLGGIVDVIWPTPRATFRLVEKLDCAFSSLLQGRDADTSEPLPGFENGRTLSTTDKVRLKGIVERTRLAVVRVMSAEPDDEGSELEVDTESGMDTEDEGMVQFEGFEHNDEDEEWEEKHIGGVFEKTLGELGDVLGGPPIGIITNDADDMGKAQCGTPFLEFEEEMT